MITLLLRLLHLHRRPPLDWPQERARCQAWGYQYVVPRPRQQDGGCRCECSEPQIVKVWERRNY